jgi:hypothetical protein
MKSLAVFAAIGALCAMPQGAGAQTGTAPFCLQTITGTRCIYGTMGACEAARGSTSYPEQCMTRTDAHGTTGLGERPRPSGPPSYDLPPPQPKAGE